MQRFTSSNEFVEATIWKDVGAVSAGAAGSVLERADRALRRPTPDARTSLRPSPIELLNRFAALGPPE